MPLTPASSRQHLVHCESTTQSRYYPATVNAQALGSRSLRWYRLAKPAILSDPERSSGHRDEHIQSARATLSRSHRCQFPFSCFDRLRYAESTDGVRSPPGCNRLSSVRRVESGVHRAQERAGEGAAEYCFWGRFTTNWGIIVLPRRRLPAPRISAQRPERYYPNWRRPCSGCRSTTGSSRM